VDSFFKVSRRSILLRQRKLLFKATKKLHEQRVFVGAKGNEPAYHDYNSFYRGLLAFQEEATDHL